MHLPRLAALPAVAGSVLALAATADAAVTANYEVISPSSVAVTVDSDGAFTRLTLEPLNHAGAELVSPAGGMCGPLTPTKLYCSTPSTKSARVAVSVSSAPPAGSTLHGTVTQGDMIVPFDVPPKGAPPSGETPTTQTPAPDHLRPAPRSRHPRHARRRHPGRHELRRADLRPARRRHDPRQGRQRRHR